MQSKKPDDFVIATGKNYSVKDLINLVLKTFWGRARPNDILQLGGKESFSPWYKYSDACVSNCSFVSGDAAGGFSLVILYLVTNNIKYA